MDCLRTIDDPANPIPYVSLLRNRLFGFSDQELYELVRVKGTLKYTAKVPEELSGELRARYEAVNQRLSKYLRWMRNLPYPAAVSQDRQ